MTEQDIAEFETVFRDLSAAEKKQSDAHKKYVRLYNLWLKECQETKDKLDAQSAILQQSASDIKSLKEKLDEKFQSHKI